MHPDRAVPETRHACASLGNAPGMAAFGTAHRQG